MAHPSLNEEVFTRIGAFIRSTWGIKMPQGKKVMLESRLQKRLRSLGLTNFDEYAQYLFSPEGMERELYHLIEVVSTNKTDFFREPQAFQYLVGRVLPEMVTRRGTGLGRPLVAWSAGCSTGEEPYSLSMVLMEFGRRHPGLKLDYNILATDVSMRVIKDAARAIYSEDRIVDVPAELRYKYFMKGREPKRGLVRVVPEIRARVRFRHLNLMDDFSLREKMDLIFCRNVIIYFDRDTQEVLLGKLCRNLAEGGHLFMGHSETLNQMRLPVAPVAPMIYRKEAA
jgi:chemotaxis protein methyltransferase CheR